MTYLPRTLEPELMDSSKEALAYDMMDHTEVNRIFVDDLIDIGELGTDILDLGTGTALIPVEVCQRNADVRILACDAAISMLELARYRLELESLTHRIQLHHGDAKSLGFADEYFDTVISNSLLHHVPEPFVVLEQIHRVLRPGGLIFVRDLFRPDHQDRIDNLVQTYAVGESDSAQQLFRQSLHAALRLDEMQALVRRLGYPSESVQITSDRHWTWSVRKPTDELTQNEA